MKLNKLFVSALAALAFVACSKDGETGTEGPENGNGISVTVALRTAGSADAQAASLGTRAVEDNFTTDNTITLRDIKVFFADGADGNIVEAKTFSSEEIEAGSATFHGINPSATHAVVVANSGQLLAATPATVAALKATELDLTSYQTDLAVVPVMSEVGALEENSTTEHPDTEGETDVTWCKVSLNVTPVLARIEIGGELGITSSTAGGAFVYEHFTSKHVGLNGLYEKCRLDGSAVGTAPVYANSNADGFPSATTPAWMYDVLDAADQIDLIADADNKITLGKVYAYNVKPGDKPEITLQFDSTPISPDLLPEDAPMPASPKAYVKIINFTDAAQNTVEIEAGKIYTVKKILFDQDKVTMLDDKVLCVEVIVEVTPWEIKDIENPEFGGK